MMCTTSKTARRLPGARRGVTDPKARERVEKRLREWRQRLYHPTIERQSTTFWEVTTYYENNRNEYRVWGKHVYRCVVRRTRGRKQTIRVTFVKSLLGYPISFFYLPKVVESTDPQRPFPELAEGHEKTKPAVSYLSSSTAAGSSSSTSTAAATTTTDDTDDDDDLLRHLDVVGTTDTVQEALVRMLGRSRRSVRDERMEIRRLTHDELSRLIHGEATAYPRSVYPPLLRNRYLSLVRMRARKSRALARSLITRHVRTFVRDPRYAWCRRRLTGEFREMTEQLSSSSS